MVHKTKNYKQFILQEEYHRESSSEYLKELEKKILKDNKLKENPIWVTEALEIVDGRHRFKIAKKNNLPIYFMYRYKTTEYHDWLNKNYA